ncbi:MAG TPA: transglutaminase-like domain-containing protein, partial [Actinomycetaceae bacterium]|nr:transglutaminase-like domain-containing protein [Actinomycetaceae bacterium]
MSILRVSVVAEFTVPGSGPETTIVRTRLESCDTETQRVKSAETIAPSAIGPGMSLRSDDGVRTVYLELPPGPARIEGSAKVRHRKPIHTSRRIPAIGWEQCAAMVRAVRSNGRTGDATTVSVPQALFIASAAMPSPGAPIDDDARDLAFSTLSPGQPLILGVAEVARRIADRNLDSVAATHKMLAAMRAVGLAAAYVMGASPERGIHSWANVYIPGYSWFPIDPLTAQPVEDGAVTLVWGRDAGDSLPVR